MREPAFPHAASMRALSEPAARILRGLAHDGAIAVTHTTAANLEFARNWYLHLQRAGVRNYALIATDDDAHATLSREVVGHVVAYPLGPAGAAQPAQSYRSRGWTRLMFAVPRMLHWVLAMGLDVLWMDTDVVALSDPFPLIRRHAAAAAAAAAAANAAAAAAAAAARLRLCHRLRLWCPRLWRRRLGRSLSIVGLSGLSEVRQIRSRRARGLR